MNSDSDPARPTVGATLAPWRLPVTTTMVISTALATRDFQDVHHDRDLAQSYGSADIFVNILTSTGLVERYVTDALGSAVDVRSIALRLGAPAYPRDTLEFSGEVTEVQDGDGAVVVTVSVRGTLRSERGTDGADHVTATVVVAR